MNKKNQKIDEPNSIPRWNQAIPPEVVGEVELSKSQKEEAKKLMDDFIKTFKEEQKKSS